MLSNNKIHFIGYSGQDPAYDLQCGFSAAGPYYGDFTNELNKCKSSNTPIVVRVGADLKFVGKDEWKEVDANSVGKEIIQQINLVLAEDESGCKPNVFAWSIWPEELRPWRKNEMNYLRLAVDIIKRYSDRPITLYNPVNRDENHLGTVIERGVDICARQAYVSFDPTEDRTVIIKSVNEACQTIKAKSFIKNNLVPGVYLKLAKDPTNKSDDFFIPKIIRHDVFLAVVCGAKCVFIWSLFKRKEVARTYDLQHNGYVSVMKEINEKEIMVEDTPIPLASILLNFKKSIQHSDNMLYTKVEYELSVTSKFIIHINSTNQKKQTTGGHSLDPFEIKYGIESDDVKIDFNSLDISAPKKYTIDDALEAYKIIHQVIKESSNFYGEDSELLNSLKERLHKEAELIKEDK